MWPQPSTYRPSPGNQNPQCRVVSGEGALGSSPTPPRPAPSCRRGTPGPESAATCPRPHCELRVALASSLESSPWVGWGRQGAEDGPCLSLPRPPRPPSQRLPLPGRTFPGSPGPACPLARGQALESNGWCKWAFGGTARAQALASWQPVTPPPTWTPPCSALGRGLSCPTHPTAGTRVGYPGSL